MRKFTLFFTVLIFATIQVAFAQNVVTLPVSGQAPTETGCEGTILDSGGSGQYTNGIDAFVVIDPPGTIPVQISFAVFSTEACCDFVDLYDGPSTASPLIGTYGGMALPNGGSPIVSTGGSMTLRFRTDGSVLGDGFVANWIAGGGGSGTPSASFVVSDLNPPANWPVYFINSSTGASSYSWDFGDGNTSTEDNPDHRYTAPGTYTIVLTAIGCTGETTTYSAEILVQELAGVTVDPTSFNVTLNYGDSIIYPLNISNIGSGSLVYSIEGAPLQSAKKLQVLSLINGADLAQEYAFTLQAINNYYTDYQLTEITTYVAAELEAALEDKDVLLIPEQETCNAAAFTAFAPVLQAFAENGGTIVMNGTNQASCIFNTGLFSGTYQNFYSGPLNLSLPEDPLVEGVANPYEALSVTFYYDITNSDVVRVVEYNNYDVVCYRNIGAGKAILIGHDYRYSNSNMQKIQANAVQNAAQAAQSQGWLYISSNAGLLGGGENATIDVEFNATDVYGGTYYQDLIIYTNDPDNPEIIVPCVITIVGTPSFALSSANFDFGTLMQGLVVQQTLTISNPGTDSLHITNITSSDPAYTVDINNFSLYGGGAEQQVVISFAPTDIQTYNATLTIQTNIGTFFVVVTGVGVGAPVTTVTPPAINVTIDAGTSTTVPLVIANSGLGPLDYQFDTSNLGVVLQVLAYTNGVDFTTEYPNTLSAINTYYTNYNLTETNTSSAAELATLLLDKDVFLVPEIETSAGVPPFIDFAPVLQAFVNNGGIVIFAGTSSALPIINSGLMPVEVTGFDTGTAVNVDDDTHPITQGISPSFPPSNGTYPIFFSGSDVVTLVSQPVGPFGGGGSVVAYTQIGSGYVVSIAFDYFSSDENAKRIIANSLIWAESLAVVPWLDYNPTEGNVGYPDETTIDVFLDATNLLGGTYQTELIINTNDPLNPTITVPVTLTVIGIPQIVVSDTNLDFGNVIIGNNNAITINIDNPGTDTLFITDISSSLPEFAASAGSIIIPPLQNANLTITYTPANIQTYTGTVTLTNNVTPITIDVSGVGVGAPITTLNPTSFNVTLLAGNSTTETLNIGNTGAGPLEFNIPGAGTAEILALTYGINSFNYTTLQNYLTTYVSDYNLTEINTTNPVALTNALVGKQVLLIPQQDAAMVNPTAIANLGTAMHTFAQNGGSVVFVGSTCSVCVTTGSMFSGAYSGQTFTNIQITNPTHPLAAGLPSSWLMPSAAFTYDFVDSDLVQVASAPGFGPNVDAIAVRPIGSGKAIYLGNNFSTSGDATLGTLIANAIGYANGQLPSWLTVSPTSGTVLPGNNTDLSLNFDATGMLAGDYTFDLLIATNQPGQPVMVVTITLTVEAFPQAAFTVDSQLSCDGIVQFTDATLNNPSSWTWDFGDGNSSTVQNPLHTYTDSGVYTVSLEACNALGCNSATYTDFITVDFTSTYCDTIPMPSDNSILQLTGCYGVLQDSGGPGNYANNQNGTVTIAPPGALSITLNFNYIQFENCCDGLRVYDGPNTSSPLLGNFKGPALPNGDGIVTSTGGSITLQQYTDGSVVNTGFELNWSCLIIDEAPTPDFSYEVTDACLGIVDFTDLSMNYPSEWTWEFGDGSGALSTDQNPQHSYQQSGTYQVTLASCNIAGCDAITIPVTVNGVLFVDFSVPNFVQINSPVMFNDNTANATYWQWNFGNGQTAVGNIANPVTFYQALGFYTVTLTVTDANGCVRTGTRTLEVVSNIGMEGALNNSLLTIAPNPTTGVFNVTYPFADSRQITLRVFDAVGKEVYFDKQNATGGYQQTLQMNDKPRGLYFVTLSSGKDFISKKVILH
ncbi:MAG: PKD domain-containing protein [Sphingobacteriales bacterium]|nr:MAG: PKD domain-containing protein [Sphingobacteriales bacterium]